MLNKQLKQFAKRIIFRHTKFGAPPFAYQIEVLQLTSIINELERLKNIKGAVVEIGVARGMTTRFVAEYLKQTNQTNQPLFAIDTFGSFVDADVDYEVEKRGKKRSDLYEFMYNDFHSWSKNFKDFPFVKPVQHDCSTFDYNQIQPIKLAFLDVDLYLPTKKTLPLIYENLVDSGVILIDDVQNNNRWDGAYQAYMEFCEERKITPNIIGNKCGVIYKNP